MYSNPLSESEFIEFIKLRKSQTSLNFRRVLHKLCFKTISMKRHKIYSGKLFTLHSEIVISVCLCTLQTVMFVIFRLYGLDFGANKFNLNINLSAVSRRFLGDNIPDTTVTTHMLCFRIYVVD